MSSSEQSSQQQSKVKKPPFSDWPTIKILSPPQGRFSIKSDEWCMTYCSQSIGGRVHSKEPNCRSICLRKVFPHEVQDIISFKKHENVGPDGKAKYPLPKEGQPINLPRLLGGTSNSDSEDRPKPPVTNYWDEGLYLWTGQGRWAFLQKTETMMQDFQKQKQTELKHESRREVWHDYQEHLKRGINGVAEQQSKFWGAIVPPMPMPNTSSVSLLVPLPPDIPPIFEKIHKFLKPTYQVLDIMHESFASGEQRQFARRVWEKLKSDEPFILAQRIIAYSYDQWKQWPPEKDDGTKDSTKS